jgi:PKD repeat protein
MITNQNSVMGYRMYAHTHTHTRNNILRLKSLILIMIMWVGSIDVGWGQACTLNGCNELLTNPSLNINSVPSNGENAFCEGNVAGWSGVEWTPHIVQLIDDNTACNFDPITNANTAVTCLRANGDGMFRESMKQFVNLSADPNITYRLRIRARMLNCGVIGNFPSAILQVRSAPFLPLPCQIGAVGNVVWGSFLPETNTSLISSDTIMSFNPTNVICHDFTVAANQAALWFRVFKPAVVPAIDQDYSVVGIDSISLTCTTSTLSGINHTGNGLVKGFSAITAPINTTYQSYSWNFGDTNSPTNTSMSANPSHAYSQAGNYTITLRVTDANGCCATQSIDVCVGSCNVSGANSMRICGITTAVRISELFPNTNTLTSFTLSVAGRLIIDKDFRFNNCNIKFEAGASMEKEPQAELRIFNNSVLEGCSNMWKGINNRGSRLLLIRNSTIRDAEYALNLRNNSTVNLSDNMFINNYVSIYSEPLGVPKTITVQAFGKNTFTASTSGWKPPYPNQQGYLLNSSFAGVLLYDVANMNLRATPVPSASGPAPNVFANLWNGIVGLNANIHCANNKFSIIGALSDVPPNMDVLSSRGIAFLVKSATRASFDSCTVNRAYRGAVFANSTMGPFSASKNNFPGMVENPTSPFNGGIVGIHFLDVQNADIKINNNNVIKDYSTGIFLEKVQSMTHCEVTSNVIRSTKPSIILKGISLMDVGGSQTYTCSFNNIQGPSRGDYIDALKVSNFLFKQNVISTTNTQSPFNGIKLQTTSSNQFRKNSVTAPGSPLNNIANKGFLATGSTNDLFCCNSTANASRGFEFTGVNSISEMFRTNSMSNHSSSYLHLTGASVGPQTYQGNVWYNSASYATTARMFGGDFTNSIFTVDTNDVAPNGGVFLPKDINVFGWFLHAASNVSTPVCAPSSNCGVPEYDYTIKTPIKPLVYPPITPQSPSDLPHLESIARGQVLNNQYYETNKWKAQSDLYDRLKEQTALLTQSYVLDSFYTSNINSHLGVMHHVETGYNELYSMTLSERSQVKGATDSIEWYNTNNGSLILNATNDSLLTLISGTLTHNDERVTALSSTLKSISDGVKNRANTQSAVLLGQITGISSTLPWVQYKRKILIEKLEYVSQGPAAVSSSDLSVMTGYGHSCYLAYGNAVHDAQAFVDFINGYNTVWQDTCVTIVTPRSKESSMPRSSIYPNPTSGLLYVEVGESAVKSISILDVSGRLFVPRYERMNMETINVDLSNFENGVYILQVTYEDDHGQQSFKVIKID